MGSFLSGRLSALTLSVALSLFPSFSFSTPSPSSIHPCLLLGYHLCLECMHMGSTGPVQLMYTAHWMYSQLTRIILDGYIYRQLPRQDQGRTKAGPKPWISFYKRTPQRCQQLEWQLITTPDQTFTGTIQCKTASPHKTNGPAQFGMSDRLAQWLRRSSYTREIAGSNPASVILFFVLCLFLLPRLPFWSRSCLLPFLSHLRGLCYA